MALARENTKKRRAARHFQRKVRTGRDCEHGLERKTPVADGRHDLLTFGRYGELALNLRGDLCSLDAASSWPMGILRDFQPDHRDPEVPETSSFGRSCSSSIVLFKAHPKMPRSGELVIGNLMWESAEGSYKERHHRTKSIIPFKR